MMRPTTSAAPPGVYGITSVIGFLGKAAKAGEHSPANAEAASAAQARIVAARSCGAGSSGSIGLSCRVQWSLRATIDRAGVLLSVEPVWFWIR